MTEIKDSNNRPLVTFALFAYNQEKYIREAIEGAFAQTYEPLEIILSDDCSTDRTFEVMKEMARKYKGRHEIRLNRNEQNIGTIDHVLTVGRLASGCFMVVGAGDDISIDTRVERISSKWFENKPLAMYSDAYLIDEAGVLIGEREKIKPTESIQRALDGCEGAFKYSGKFRNIAGYSAAYDIATLNRLPLCGVKALNEDALMSIYINVLGGEIGYLEEKLLYYRVGAGVSSGDTKMFPSLNDFLTAEKKRIRFSESSCRFYPYLFSVLRNLDTHDSRVVLNNIRYRLELANVMVECSRRNFFGRFLFLFQSRNLQEFKSITPRVFGLRALAFLKFLRARFGR